MIIKQYFTDGLIQLAIILSILRTDVTNYFTRNYIRYPEVQEIVLGNSLIYTQTDFHRNVINSIDSVQLHPKALRNNDRYISSIFQDIRELGQYARYSPDINTDIHAFLVGQEASVAYRASPAVEYLPPLAHTVESVITVNDEDVGDPESVSEGLENDVGSVQVDGAASVESPPLPLSSEPTKEDLDLIEVLWRQDIDLGIGREAFDPVLRRELEQERELELEKQRQKQHERDVLQYKLEQERRQEAHQWLNQHYVQDGETGEWMPAPNPEAEQVTSPSALTDVQEDESLSYDEAWRILDGVATDIPMEELDEYVNPRNTLALPDIDSYAGPLTEEAESSLLLTVSHESEQTQDPLDRLIQTGESDQTPDPLDRLIQTGEGDQTQDLLDRLIQTGEGELNRLMQCNEDALDTFLQARSSSFTPSPLTIEAMPETDISQPETYDRATSFEPGSTYGRQTSFEQNWQDLVSLLDLPENNRTNTSNILNTGIAQPMEIPEPQIPLTLMIELSERTDALLENTPIQLPERTDGLLHNVTLSSVIGLENSTELTPTPPGRTSSSFALVPDLNNNHTTFTHDSVFMPMSDHLSPPINPVTTNDTLGQPVTLSWNPTDVMFPELNSPGNGTDSVNMSQVEHMLQDFLPDGDFEGITLDDMQLSDNLESLQMADDANHESLQMADDASRDSAISSLGGASPHSQDLTDPAALTAIPATLSDTTSFTTLTSAPRNMSESTSLTLLSPPPFDGLEGATGGSDVPSDSKLGKYDPEDYSYTYSHYNDGQNRSDMNYSSSSNDTSFGDDNGLCPVQHNHTYPAQPGMEPRDLRTKATKTDKLSPHQQKPISRDHRRALGLKLPLSVEQVINTPVEEFNDLVTRYKLNEPQLQLIRDIRRRGKNKVAAQNCRKRKFDVIFTLSDDMDNMLKERDRLQRQRRLLDKETREVKERFNQLYEDILQSLRDENGQPYDPDAYSLQLTTDGNVFLVPRNDSPSMSSSGRSMSSGGSMSSSSSSSGASTSGAEDTPHRASNRKRKHDKQHNS